MLSRTVATFFFIILAAASAALSAEESTAKPTNAASAEAAADREIRAGVSRTLAEFQKRFDGHDAKGLAELWKPGGHFVGPRGERVSGREAIAAAFAEFFAEHKNCKLQLAVVGGHAVTKDVAVVDAISEITPAPKGFEGEPHATIVFALHDGRWLIDSLRETVASTASHTGRLKDLAWMVGDWTCALAGPGDISRNSTCDWTANRSFLIRKFSVVGRGGSAASGTEVIGWDPRAHRIRSWVFESDGGFGQSEWTRDGDRWTIKYSGVLADGSDVSATHIVTRVDADTLTLQSIDRTADGEKRPDAAEATIKRHVAKNAAKPEPAKPPRQVLP